MTEANYSEKIEFSEDGFRMAVLAPNGRVTHLDNWRLEMFGGVLPVAGDRITTLWDTERPEPAECYEVVSRQWIGELKGDNCWWLLLQAIEPSATDRQLFRVAREQSLATKRHTGATYADLVEIRTLLEKKQEAVTGSKLAKKPIPKKREHPQRKRPPG